MATLVLQAAGAFAGNMIGGPFGAMIGQTAGAVAGALIDQRIFGQGGARSYGPRLTRQPGLAIAEGTPVARVYGRARVGGTLIWMTRFEEQASMSRSASSGGKSASSPGTTNYDYYANFAVGVCEGPVAQIRRIWADGVEIDQTRFTIRTHAGAEDQEPDPLIVAKEGADHAPSYAGTAYVVFERLPLGDFGNRIPQFSFEVVRPVSALSGLARAVCIIPSSSEFAYEPATVIAGSAGVSTGENRHVLTCGSDWDASIDSLQAICPQVEDVSLVVSWFGTDLRAGQCRIEPRPEKTAKGTPGFAWSVAGLARGSANPVSQYDGKPAYGGTPSDASVIAAIADLKARGVRVVFYPFVMMDVPQGNVLTDPWSGATSQPAYPWRGDITCHPAPGRAGTPDGSPAAATQVSSFFGSAAPADGEWSYRRFILHYANLCKAAGGVDAFLIGSELRGLTRVRSASGIYPAVSALVALAADVKAILGASTQVSYAADWTEYGAHVLNSGSEVRFPLDPLWASAAIDFVGIDAYWPLSDWRDGRDHADAAIAASIHDRDYLRSRMTAGEAYDWHYADEAARLAQNRTPIVDGLSGQAWMFRQKDVAGWWNHAHVERVAGAELSAPTAWIAGGKPVRIIETGCPAVDRGTNAPSVFPDIKSSEKGLPWFSRGFRDDLLQLRALEAFLSHFDTEREDFVDSDNPLSPVYGGRMVEPRHIYLWAWDARPFPAFPQQGDVWADAPAWATGHWLNGRLEAAPVDDLVGALAYEAAGDARGSVEIAIDAIADGYVLDQPVSARAAIEPLAALFGFDAAFTSGAIRFTGRGGYEAVGIQHDMLVPRRNGDVFEIARMQESEIARQLSLSFSDSDSDYRTATVSTRRPDTVSRRASASDLALVSTRTNVRMHLDRSLQDMWSGRETIMFDLMPSQLHLEIGDGVEFDVGGSLRRFLVTRIGDGVSRAVTARAFEPGVYEHAPRDMPAPAIAPPSIPGPPHVQVLDLAIARAASPVLQYAAVFADPWPGRMAVWRREGGAFTFLRHVEKPAFIGHTLEAFGPGILGRYDRANALLVQSAGGALQSVGDVAALNGRNLMAIGGADGRWEICAFLQADLVAAGTWRLSKLLRGGGGEDELAARTIAAGAPVVLLDEAVVELTSDLAALGQTFDYRIGPANRDYADVSYQSISATVTNVALRPYAPVRVRARRTAAGVAISFLRRTRLGGDGWDLVSIPLAEESESYEVEIRASANASSNASTSTSTGTGTGTVVKRILRVNAPLALYAAADEIADFGSPQDVLSLALFQTSATVGRGFGTLANIPVQ